MVNNDIFAGAMLPQGSILHKISGRMLPQNSDHNKQYIWIENKVFNISST